MLNKKYIPYIISTGVMLLLIIIYVLYGSYKITHAPARSSADIPTGVISGTFDTSKFKSDSEWKKILTSDQYYILREAGTEVPFTGKLEYENRKGTYYSAGCNEPVFRSEAKYDSGTGWPSFYAPIHDGALVLKKDDSIAGQERIEVLDKCGGHLGHVFDDGPAPTGKRYCMNSGALIFVPDKEK